MKVDSSVLLGMANQKVLFVMYVVCRCGSYDKQIIVALQELKRAVFYKKKNY
jgi:hypothetical protein